MNIYRLLIIPLKKVILGVIWLKCQYKNRYLSVSYKNKKNANWCLFQQTFELIAANLFMYAPKPAHPSPNFAVYNGCLLSAANIKRFFSLSKFWRKNNTFFFTPINIWSKKQKKHTFYNVFCKKLCFFNA